MRDALLLLAVFVAFGAHAAAPFRLADGPARSRKIWSAVAPLLLVGGLLAWVLLIHSQLAGAVAQGIAPLGQGRAGRALVVCSAALLLCDLLLLLGSAKVPPLGWRIAAGLGAAAAAAAAWLGELLRLGEGPATSGWPLAAAVVCRLLVGLAAGEAVAPGKPAAAVAAGLAFPVYALLLPDSLSASAAERGLGWTVGAAAVLFVAARWLPARFRRASLAAGVVLAVLYFSRIGELSAALGGQPQPVPPLPAEGSGPTMLPPPGSLD